MTTVTLYNLKSGQCIRWCTVPRSKARALVNLWELMNPGCRAVTEAAL